MTKPFILNVRNWLRASPLIDQSNKFGINFLEDTPTAYVVDDVPVTPVLQSTWGGTIKQKAFVIATRDAYSSDVLENAASSGFFDDFSAWVHEQNKIGNYPAMLESQEVRSIEVTSSGYPIETGTDTARYQIQILMTYFERR